MSDEHDPLEGFRGREIPLEERELLDNLDQLGMDPEQQNKLQRGEVVNHFLRTLPGQFLVERVRDAETVLHATIQQMPRTSKQEVETAIYEYRVACDGLLYMNRVMQDAQAVISNIETEEQLASTTR